MNPTRGAEILRQLLTQLSQIALSADTTEFVSWRSRTRSTLEAFLGQDHHIAQQFDRLHWRSISYVISDTPDDGRADFDAFLADRDAAQGLLEAAVFELETLREGVAVTEDSGVDPELWAHVAVEVQAEAWDKVAVLASVFTEHRIRTWTGRPRTEIGAELAIKVFGAKGDYRLGKTDGEKEGWQQLATGVAKAVRNVDGHHIQSRADHKRYALSVVGAYSLLLTQMRYEHGNRFMDNSPVNLPVLGEAAANDG